MMIGLERLLLAWAMVAAGLVLISKLR